MEGARKPVDYYDAKLRMGELGVLGADFARRLAPLAGLRKLLAHEYLTVDWDHVLQALQRLDDLERFAEAARLWLAGRTSQGDSTTR